MDDRPEIRFSSPNMRALLDVFAMDLATPAVARKTLRENSARRSTLSRLSSIAVPATVDQRFLPLPRFLRATQKLSFASNYIAAVCSNAEVVHDSRFTPAPFYAPSPATTTTGRLERAVLDHRGRGAADRPQRL